MNCLAKAGLDSFYCVVLEGLVYKKMYSVGNLIRRCVKPFECSSQLKSIDINNTKHFYFKNLNKNITNLKNVIVRQNQK